VEIVIAKVTTKTFVERASKVHNNKFSYQDTTYVKTHQHVVITCPIHGNFSQTPGNHLQGNGCPKCSAKHTYTTDEFIDQAISVHGTRYDYSHSACATNNSKVLIRCIDHNIVFEQTPNKHLLGQGCPTCGRTAKRSLHEFINQSNAVHQDLYDYSRVKYINTHTKVEIICPVHGVFVQAPVKHINQQCGCPKCAPTYSKTRDEFINKVNQVHFNEYDYTELTYVNSRTNIVITCPIHGGFTQIASNHTQGHGCPKCNWVGRYDENNLLGTTLVGTCYLIKLLTTKELFFKVGITTDLSRRLRTLSKDYVCTVHTLVTGNMLDVYQVERAVLSHPTIIPYTPLNPFSGYTECFQTKDITILESIMCDMVL